MSRPNNSKALAHLGPRIGMLGRVRFGSVVNFAKHMGVGTETVYGWIRGSCRPSLEPLVGIADACGVTTDALLRADQTTIEVRL